MYERYCTFDIIGVSCHESALRLYWAGDNLANEMNHDPGERSIALPVDQQSNVLPLCYGCSRLIAQYASEKISILVAVNIHLVPNAITKGKLDQQVTAAQSVLHNS